jgi:hypothetical protein
MISTAVEIKALNNKGGFKVKQVKLTTFANLNKQ